MMNKRIDITLDCPEDTSVNFFTVPNKYLKSNYIRSFQDEMTELAIDRSFSGTDLRILLAIIGNLEYDNIFSLSQRELGEIIKIDKVEISKTFKKLCLKGYLKPVKKIGRQNVYIFNPNVVFKSKAKNLKDLKHAWDKEVIPNTQNKPIDINSDLEPDLEDKLDYRVSQLSQQFGVPQSKVRQIILSLVDRALENEEQEKSEIPY